MFRWRPIGPAHMGGRVADARGRTVRKLNGVAEPVHNRVVWNLQPERDGLIGGRRRSGRPEVIAPAEYTTTMKAKGAAEQKIKLVVTAPDGVGTDFLAP